jgi:hypothetical protein
MQYRTSHLLALYYNIAREVKPVDRRVWGIYTTLHYTLLPSAQPILLVSILLESSVRVLYLSGLGLGLDLDLDLDWIGYETILSRERSRSRERTRLRSISSAHE